MRLFCVNKRYESLLKYSSRTAVGSVKTIINILKKNLYTSLLEAAEGKYITPKQLNLTSTESHYIMFSIFFLVFLSEIIL